MDNRIRIALAEDHQLVRQGMVSLLQDEEDFNVVFDVSNGSELLDAIQNQEEGQEVEIILLDLNMPVISGQQALKIITEKHPEIKVIVVSSHYSEEFIWEAVKLGARGFLPKNSDIEEVVKAIRSVDKLDYYFDDKLSKESFQKIAQQDSFSKRTLNPLLSEREIEVLKLVCEGKKIKEISDILFIGIKTVETHRRNLYEKIECKNIAGMMAYALKNGYFKIS